MTPFGEKVPNTAWARWIEHYMACKTCSLAATIPEDRDVFCKTGRRFHEAAWSKWRQPV